ncbi:hypothetical protein BCF59_0689 [Mycoplasmopsis mustelae]|uniref:Lipoprotein n=1 Tax=Mycoplasmopsis mustelae TaxID=171289 RepID=A0A4R7UDM7_9BACT|nr:hypothetical protein [Mycoplasmopsis mustelae]TDV23066.1 hypothetical protein BCF59_0689 [Mycoplasmopsis mustelae]
MAEFKKIIKTAFLVFSATSISFAIGCNNVTSLASTSENKKKHDDKNKQNSNDSNLNQNINQNQPKTTTSENPVLASANVNNKPTDTQKLETKEENSNNSINVSSNTISNQTEKNDSEPKKQLNNTKQNTQKNTIDNWADDNANNFLNLVAKDKLNELISQNQKLFYDYKSKRILLMPTETRYLNQKSLPDDRSPLYIFELNDNNTEYQLANDENPINTNKSGKVFINSLINYQKDGDFVIVKYRIAKYISGQDPKISERVYQNKFNLKQEDQSAENKDKIIPKPTANANQYQSVTVATPTPNTIKDKTQITSENKSVFVRPPFGVKFQVVSHSDCPPIVVVFDHLDSPGPKTNSSYYESKVLTNSSLFHQRFGNLEVPKNGAQEFSEFMALPNVLEFYKKLSGNDESLVIFGGDTNIDAKNFKIDKYFPQEVNKVLVSQTNTPLKDWYTSLNTKGGYSNPYDKMYYLNGEDASYNTITTEDNPNLIYKIDIYKIFNEFFDRSDRPTNKSYNWYDSSNSKGNYDSNIRNKISDHAPVFVDVKLNHITLATAPSLVSEYLKAKNTLRISHWNILNYGNKNVNKYASAKDLKIKAIAEVIKKSGFDITGLTEINNGNGESVKLILNELNKDGGNYKLIIQNQKDTIWTNNYRFFSGAQTEQVAIIYNANVLNLSNFNTINQPFASYLSEFPLYGEVTQLK